MKPLLECRNVAFSYHANEGEVFALDEVNFTVHSGEFVSIVGPSGCGKSTLLSLISGLMEPASGELLLNGQPLKKSQVGIGYMLQKDHLLEWRTIHKNVLLGLEIQNKLGVESVKKVDDMLAQYGLSAFTNVKPSALSGGMRQRAALVRTLATEPDLLLLDEPFSALDYQTRLEVADDIGAIIKREGKTAILVTHDLSEAISMADKVIVLTNRPAKVKATVPISFDLENDTPMLRRDCDRFRTYFNRIWKELKSDG